MPRIYMPADIAATYEPPVMGMENYKSFKGEDMLLAAD